MSDRAEMSNFSVTSWTLSPAPLDVEVELNVELRLDLPGIDLRSARILDREILHILREDRNLRLAAVVRAIAARTLGSWSAI